jgi:hypothetical protein
MAEKETFSLRIFERKELPLILSAPQYLSLLKLANHKTAMKWAKSDWEEMKSRGISEGLDSAKVTRDIYHYDLARLVIRDKYGESIPTNHSLKTFETPMPAALSKLKTARRYNNPIPDQSANAKFSW